MTAAYSDFEDAIPPISETQPETTLERFHKDLFTSVICRVIPLYSIFLIIASWRNEPLFYLGLFVDLMIVVVNLAISHKSQIFKFGRFEIDNRSDIVDTLRWSFNFIADFFVFYAFQLTPAIALLTLIIVSFGALTEVYRPRPRKFIFVLACIFLVVFNVTMFPRDLIPITHIALYLAGFVGAVTMLLATERWLHREMKDHFETKGAYQNALSQAERIKKDAVVGNQLRSFSHEISNTLAVIEINLTSEEECGPQELAIIKRALEKASKLNNLILSDLKNGPGNFLAGEVTMRNYSLSLLAEDISLLLAGDLAKAGIDYSFDLGRFEDESRTKFDERPGSTYFIFHNLLKNAKEAIEERQKLSSAPLRGCIEISAELIDKQLVLHVRDNGIGMDDAETKLIKEGNHISTKTGGHGIGMRFVLDEVRKNGFDLVVRSKVGEGTSCSLAIPL